MFRVWPSPGCAGDEREGWFSFFDGRKKHLSHRPCAGCRHKGDFCLRIEGGGKKESLKGFSPLPFPLFEPPGDGEQRKAPASPGCYIDQNKARLGEGGGSLRGEGTPFARQRKGVPSPLNQKNKKLSTKSLTNGGHRRSVRLRRLRRTASDAKASRN